MIGCGSASGFYRSLRVVRLATPWLLVFTLILPWLARDSAEAEMSLDSYEIVGEALHVADLNDWTRSLRLINSLDDALARKFFQWFRLVNEKGDTDFNELARFIIENPLWPRIDDLQELAEGRLTDSADQSLTLQLFEDREPVSTRGRIRLAEALFAVGEDEKAALHVKHAWTQGDFTASEEQSFLRRHKRHLNQYDHEKRLESLLWGRQWRAAKRMLKKVPEDHQKLAKARLALQQQSPGVDGAVAAVPAVFEKDSGLAYDRIRWRRLKGKHKAAVELLLDPPEQLVRHERWWFERSYQIRRALERRDFETAYQLASRHGQQSGSDYTEAEWLAGWLALRFNNRPKTAFRHFVRLYDRVVAPVRQARASYWAGRASSDVGDQPGAIAWYRRAAIHHATYYGQLAAIELAEKRVTPAPVVASESEKAGFYARDLVQVASMLIAAGATNHLDSFLLALSDQAETAAEISLIADLAIAGGRPSLLAQVGRRAAFQGNVYSPAAFPLMRIKQLLQPSADSVEPALLLALARQESMFRSKAKSGAGARGLLQILPSTAKVVARRAGEKFDVDRLVSDFNYNALLGGHYIGSLLKRFDGEPALALAGYNAGPYRVSKWIKKHGDPRPDGRHAVIDWVELIPFEETRNYVQRVMEGYYVYNQHLASGNVALIDYHGSHGTYPPPMPMAKPRDDRAESLETASTTVAAPIHRPVFRPLDALAETFDDQASRRIAADEGTTAPVID